MGRYSNKLLKPRKTLAVTLDRPKTAALAFDYVYGPSEAKIPGGVGPGLAWFPQGANSQRDPMIRVKVTRSNGTNHPEGMAVASSEVTLRHHLQHQKDELFSALRAEGLHAVEFLESHTQTYARGDDRFIFAVLEGVVGVNEEDLDWDQVRDFRRDEDATQAYRSLLQWFNENCVGMESREAEHHICTTYELATNQLNKHGIKLGFGTIATVMAGASGLAAALASGVGAAGALLAGSVMATAGGGLTAKICDEYLRRKESKLIGPLAYVQKYQGLPGSHSGR